MLPEFFPIRFELSFHEICKKKNNLVKKKMALRNPRRTFVVIWIIRLFLHVLPVNKRMIEA